MDATHLGGMCNVHGGSIFSFPYTAVFDSPEIGVAITYPDGFC